MNAIDHPPSAQPAPDAEMAARASRLHQLSLVLYPDPVLRTVCRPVEAFDSTLRDLVEEMFELMAAHEGIGLSGPQVALEQQVLVAAIEGRRLCLANPEIQDAAEPGEFIEGCLSLPGIQVKVPRPERLRVAGFDPQGRRTSFGATGLWARVIQHEMDHLNGILICDRGMPLGEACAQCPLLLPAVLVEERKQRSRPHPHRLTWGHRTLPPPPHAPGSAL